MIRVSCTCGCALHSIHVDPTSLVAGEFGVQGGYDDGAAHAIAFATTDDVFVILWRSDQSGNYLGHRFISMREVSSE